MARWRDVNVTSSIDERGARARAGNIQRGLFRITQVLGCFIAVRVSARPAPNIIRNIPEKKVHARARASCVSRGARSCSAMAAEKLKNAHPREKRPFIGRPAETRRTIGGGGGSPIREINVRAETWTAIGRRNDRRKLLEMPAKPQARKEIQESPGTK